MLYILLGFFYMIHLKLCANDPKVISQCVPPNNSTIHSKHLDAPICSRKMCEALFPPSHILAYVPNFCSH